MVPHPVLSDASKEARDIVRQPQALRQPVGYRREFLDAYEPGKTWYLPENLRDHLRRAGQSEHMAAMPPGTYARHVLDRLLIDLSWNSSRLEGNTYSLLETDHLLQMGKADAGRWVESQMILNHKAAIEFLVEAPSELGWNRYTLLNLHAILTDGLLKDGSAEGRLRLGPVGIGGSVFHPLNNPLMLEECFDLILKKTALIPDPLEQSFFLMVHLPYLQAFEDGNKRVSRLSANLPLIQRNLSPLSFVDVTARDYADGILSVYELNRVEVLRDLFAWAYERSAWRYATVRQEIGEPDPMQARYRDEIKERVRETVVQRLDKPAAAEALRQWAARNVTAGDRGRFIEMVERQLLGLNEGNIARVRVRPSELAAWLPAWRGGHR
jgi:Fic family protein